MFDLVFNGMAAFQQAALFLAALFFLAIGGLFLWNEVWARLTSVRVTGNVVGVRQKGACYYAVYSYMLPSGETFESTADSGSSFIKGKETNRTTPLLVSKKDPLRVRPANSYSGGILGILLLTPGVMLARFFLASSQTTPLTWLVLGGIIFYGAMRFRKFIIPKNERLSPAAWKESRKAARQKEMESLPLRQIEDILASPEMKAEKEKQKKDSRFAAPFVLLFAVGLMYGGYTEYGKISSLEKNGLRAQGKIIEMKAKNGQDGSYAYYPVVTFTDQKGAAVTFRGHEGSNPPMYKTGEKVAVLYEARQPQKTAYIDHGFWNRVIPMVIFGGGALLLLLFFKTVA